MPEEVVYTHEYEIEVGEITMSGDCEFNVDGEASFMIDNALENITVDQHIKIARLFKTVRELFRSFGGDLRRINFEEK